MKDPQKEKKEKVSFVVDGTEYKTYLPEGFEERPPYEKPSDNISTAFIPGTVSRIYVRPGQHVRKGDKLLILEAMKMKNRVLASLDGVVGEVLVKEGDRVTKGQALVFLEKKSDEL